MSGKETLRYLDKFHEFVEKNDNFIVSGHMSADGDAIASCLGVAEILEQQGKQFDVVFHDDVVDPRFSYLEKYPTIKNCDHFCCSQVGCGNYVRYPRDETPWSGCGFLHYADG